jgi:hypothetical protein
VIVHQVGFNFKLYKMHGEYNIELVSLFLDRKTTCGNTGYTQNNGAVSIVKTIETAPFFCVYPVQHGQTYKILLG